MTMSVAETGRGRSASRKAIGASHLQVVRQFLADRASSGLAGGATGLVIGWVFTMVANARGNDAGTPSPGDGAAGPGLGALQR